MTGPAARGLLRRTAPHGPRHRTAAVAALAVAVTVFTATVPLLRDWFDLRVYYGTVDSWLHHGGRIYDYVVPGTAYGFTYPPFAALCMAPMALLGWHGAVAVALLLDAAALALVLVVLAGADGRPLDRHRWAALVCLLALFEPLRDTVSFGQVNLLLLALVLADARLLATGRDRWAGAGIGLAAAIKLTPVLFVGLLLLGGRRRAAAVAGLTAAAATALAAAAVPDASRFYWTRALWDTGRVGRLAYVSNQSLRGVLARLGETGGPLWAAAAVLVLAVWARRSRGATAAGDWPAAFALTGAAACLVSPVTWVHHLVWLLPALAVLLRAGRVRAAAGVYLLLCSSVVWLWVDDASGLDGFLGANAYTWATLGLLLALPAGQSRRARPARRRSVSSTAPTTRPAAPTTAPVSGQSVPATVTAAGVTTDAACTTGRSPSSEPTGSTLPAASKPQSSSPRASS
ncbi:glycosyltransferase 87 family protein [Streptomyces tropicalis]|uniref:glycosyltransferase 87 family protein n=1 Tax=Streptomyces tropicalis TaxID=3034234 RepID=UPI0028BDDF51|nr:glycosyltransferase 87 family protein [Streptomyces tropicalis]